MEFYHAHILTVVLFTLSLTLPNRHHVTVDLTPFGRSNDNEIFVVLDRPYGLIEGTVGRT